MPNIIISRLHIDILDESEERFNSICKILFIEDNTFSFNHFVSLPLECTDEKKWKLENWGTKWDAFNVLMNVENNQSVSIKFSTAWAYPKPIIDLIFEQLSGALDVKFVAAEEDGQFSLCRQKMFDEEVGTFNFSDSKEVSQALFFALDY